MRDIEKYAKDYCEEMGFESFVVKYRRKKIVERLEIYKPKKVLEIGCGFEPLFLFTRGIEYTIVEPSEMFVDKALSLAREDDKVKVQKGFFEDVAPSLPHDYDMVICACLLHELENPEKMLEAISNVCNENTIVYISVPNAKSMHRLLAMESGLIKDEHEMTERNILLQQHRVYDLESLASTIQEYGRLLGGGIIDKGSYFVKPFTHGQMEQILSYKIIEESVLDGFYNLEKYMPEYGSEIFIEYKVRKEF